MKEEAIAAGLLAMDTSTSALTVALLWGDQLLGEKNIHSERNHSARLVPAIRELMRECGKPFTALDLVAVGQGPGSYTGVRIGVTVAKTMAWSLGIPLIGVSSLQTLAFGAIRDTFGDINYDENNGDSAGIYWAVPLMDARRGQAYTGLYVFKDGQFTCAEQDGIRPLEQWMKELDGKLGACHESERPGRILWVGEKGILDRVSMSLAGMGSGFITNKSRLTERAVRAADLALLAADKYRRKEWEPVHRFVPNYTQLAEAEVKWKLKTDSLFER